jgi:FkbM family methyltransferase
LRANRTAELIFDAVWSSSNLLLEFREVSQKEFSTFREFSDKDQHAKLRSEGFDYSVKTISLPDLIRKCNIPEKLDYLSLDTEGSEFEIIRDVDFETFRPKVITVEHNFTSNRQKIFDLLTSFGYKRCYEELSRWDDWYTI